MPLCARCGCVETVSAPTVDPQRLSSPRQLAAASIGNLVEWYDVYIYTVFVSYFEKQFFAPEDANSTIYVYAIFAVTFLMRPVLSAP